MLTTLPLLWALLMPLSLAGAADDSAPSLSAQRLAMFEMQDRLRHRTLKIDQLDSINPRTLRPHGAPPLSAKGPLLLVHLWSVNCPPCIKEMPALQQLLRQLWEENHIRIVFVSQDSVDALQAYVGRAGGVLPTGEQVEHYLAGPESQLRISLQEVPLPLTLLLDSHMIVREAFVGPLVGRGNELFSTVRKLCRSLGADCQRSQ